MRALIAAVPTTDLAAPAPARTPAWGRAPSQARVGRRRSRA